MSLVKCSNIPDAFSVVFDKEILDKIISEFNSDSIRLRMEQLGHGRYLLKPHEDGAKIGAYPNVRGSLYQVRETGRRPKEMIRGGYFALAEVESQWFDAAGWHIIADTSQHYSPKPRIKSDQPELDISREPAGETGGEVQPQAIPVRDEVKTACELLNRLNSYVRRGLIVPCVLQRKYKLEFAFKVNVNNAEVRYTTPFGES